MNYNLLVQTAALVVSSVTAGAVLWVGRQIQRSLNRLEETEERSKRNERLLIGTDARRGVIDHVPIGDTRDETDE